MGILLKKKIKHWLLAASLGGALVVGIPALERATAPLPPADSHQMALYVFDVGQGDAILAQEDDKQILVDGGPNDSILEKLGDVMPPEDRKIELVILTHPHSDHVTGLDAVLKRYAVGRVLKTDVAAPSAIDRAFEADIKGRGIAVDDPGSTKEERVGDMVYEMLHYEDGAAVEKKHKGSDDGLNDSSIVGMLSFKERKFLLMGDATQAVEGALIEEQGDKLKADFLKVGHHGSAYSTSPEFLASVAPAYAAISLGAKNSYGFPAWRVLKLLEQNAVATYRTDLNGTVAAVTDGESLQVSAERVN